ncbi:type II toxin-antitoxin system RelE/ParE family toxin [Rhodomicrobium vannielii]|uniref:type II toxin-antitoxin system RelE/ParE family toxin n=1 Tax=Rhodomicrobium vannielii TaxID=1069 RepID=UPI00030780B0|nr:type II toxin-antitoxin system RelE/ParE family toxin [Rhodomicrobium vannielii]
MPTHPPLSPKRLDISDAARADIRETITHLTEKAGGEVAMRFLQRIDDELVALADLGHSGVSREWISPGLRLHVLGDYCIYFRVTDRETRVVRFLHGARDVSAIVFDFEH